MVIHLNPCITQRILHCHCQTGGNAVSVQDSRSFIQYKNQFISRSYNGRLLLLLGVKFGYFDSPVVLTESRSLGRSSPLLMPLFMEIKRSRVVLSFTLGLWRLVFNIMMAKDRM